LRVQGLGKFNDAGLIRHGQQGGQGHGGSFGSKSGSQKKREAMVWARRLT